MGLLKSALFFLGTGFDTPLALQLFVSEGF